MAAFVAEAIKRNPERFQDALAAARNSDHWEELAFGFVTGLYMLTHKEQAADLADRIRRLERDLEEEVNALRKIKNPTAQAIALKLTDQLNEVFDEIDRVRHSLEHAREEMLKNDGRRKAEALRAVIRQVRFRFRHIDRTGKARVPDYVLECAEVLPVGSDDPCPVSLETAGNIPRDGHPTRSSRANRRRTHSSSRARSRESA
jgi:hypothetical protein